MRGIWGKDGTRVVASDSTWADPGKWNRKAACTCGGGFRGSHSPYCPQANRPRVFCASLADVFEDWQHDLRDSQGQRLWTNESVGVWETDDAREGFAFRRHWTRTTLS